MVERHQDFQLTVPSLPAGGLTSVGLQLDTDAPMLVRLVKSRNLGLNGWNFQTPRRVYHANGLQTDWITPTIAGQGAFPSRGTIISPEMVFPPGSQIVCDLGNATGAPITNARLLFRGSKLYREGAIMAPTFPERMAVLPFTYPLVVKGVGLSGSQNSVKLSNPLQIANDADFAVLAMVCDPYAINKDGGPVSIPPRQLGGVTALPQFTEVYVQIRDEARKAYSNEPIHVNDLFGQGLPTPAGSGTDNDLVLFTPGLTTPMIYIPADHAIYLDVFRFDTLGTPVDLHFRFIGLKVFEQ